VWDDSTEFLQPRDAYICSSLVNGISAPSLLEIGVWKGGWIFSMLRNHPDALAVGIDPYPVKEVKAKFLDAVNARNLGARVNLYESSNELLIKHEHASFDFIHIDGEHTETAVESDLKFGLMHLTSNGVIAIDDIFHGDFPGIAYAVFNFISRNPVAPFLITPGKIYICHEENYQKYNSLTKKILNDADIEFKTEFVDENSPNGYFQTNSIKGFKQIIVPEGQRQAEKYAKKLKIKNVPRSLKYKTKKVVRLFLPEIALILSKSISPIKNSR
jgi:hypothetical protein